MLVERRPSETSTPITRTVPEVGARSPVRILSVTVLPAPFGPSSAWISPDAHGQGDDVQRDVLPKRAGQPGRLDGGRGGDDPEVSPAIAPRGPARASLP